MMIGQPCAGWGKESGKDGLMMEGGYWNDLEAIVLSFEEGDGKSWGDGGREMNKIWGRKDGRGLEKQNAWAVILGGIWCG